MPTTKRYKREYRRGKEGTDEGGGGSQDCLGDGRVTVDNLHDEVDWGEHMSHPCPRWARYRQ